MAGETLQLPENLRFHFDYKAYGIAGRRRPFQHKRLLVLGQQRPD
jgi:hypothetical protein